MNDIARYSVRYKLEVDPAGWTRAELGDDGGCDAIIVHSLIYPEDGSRSEMLLSVDGRTGDVLSDIELFKSWVMLAHRLMDAPGLGAAAQDLARRVFTDVQSRILTDKTSLYWKER